MFSQGRVTLPYLRNRLATQSFRALLCVGDWLKHGLITDKDIHAILAGLPDVQEDNGEDVDIGWDRIN